MSTTTRSAGLLGLLLMAGCPSPTSSPNPADVHKLWLAPNGSELVLKLQPVEPEPY